MRLFLLALILFPSYLLSQKKPPKQSKYSLAEINLVPAAPDYSDLAYWVAHPEKEDMADLVPGKGELIEYQGSAEVDVFFIYPTIYSKKKYPAHPWYADVNDEKLNKKIAKSTIKNQATIFNGSGKIYAPLYRQAHLEVFYRDLDLKVLTLEFAYRDVRKAFKYYLENYNNGRPIIIASHSQGTMHAVSLLREFFDEQKLQDQLVAAYIVGMPLRKGTFNTISYCTKEEDFGCWMSWNTYIKDYYPPGHAYLFDDALSTNPLSWKTDSIRVSFGMNKGGVLRNYKKIRVGLSDAQNKEGMLWINKPKFFGNFLINWDRYHIADYNLFYMNVRDNVEKRVELFLKN